MDPRAPHLPLWLAIGLALLCGFGTATQTRVNGELAQQLQNGPVAAIVSFGSGFIVIAALTLLLPSARKGTVALVDAVRRRTFRWYFLFGGLVGALFVLSQGLVGGILGVALFTIAVVAGQSLSGTLLDRRGLGTMQPRAITWNRLLGAGLALAAVIFAMSAELRGSVPWWMLLLPFAAGLGIAWQQAVNGQVRQVSGSVITATFNNFVSGTAALAVIVLVWSLWLDWPSRWPSNPLLYSGGLIGAIFIGIGAFVVRRIGTLLLGLCTIAGQLIASVLFDAILPIPGHTLTIAAAVGAGVALVAVLIAGVPVHRRWRPDPLRAR